MRYLLFSIIILSSHLSFSGYKSITDVSDLRQSKRVKAYKESRLKGAVEANSLSEAAVFASMSKAAKRISKEEMLQVKKASRSDFANPWGGSFLKRLKKQYTLLKNKVLPPRSVHRVGSSPEAGGISFQEDSGGSRPIVSFYTQDVISDSDGTVESVLWDYGDGTSQEFPTSIISEYGDVAHVYEKPGHYSVHLTLTDNDGNETVYQTYIDISQNQMPISKFSVNTVSGTAPLNVTFTFEGSDPEGLLASYFYKLEEDVYSNDVAQLTHTYTNSGTYRVELFVFDQAGAVSRSEVTIYVDDPVPAYGSLPSPAMRATDLVGSAPHTVYFDATESFDIEGPIASYEWDFGDYSSLENFSDSPTPNHTYTRAGTYVARLSVTDAQGGKSDYNFDVYVEGEANGPPKILVYQDGDSRSIYSERGKAVLRNSVRHLNYRWFMGDGGLYEGEGFYHTYASDGTYQIQLHAHDVFGNFHLATKDVTISATEDTPDVSFVRTGSTVSLLTDVTFDSSGSSDPGQGLALEHYLDLGDNTVVVNQPTYTHQYKNADYYKTQVFVTNTRGLSKRRSRTVAVNSGEAPFADLQYSPRVGAIPHTVSFDASASFSKTSSLVKYHWSGPDGVETSTSPMYSYTFNNAGEEWIDVIVEDEFGNKKRRSARVLSYDAGDKPATNNSPVADIDYTVDGTNHKMYYFDAATGSGDPESDDIIFSWKVNGVPVGTDEGYLDYEFPNNNFYNVEVTVTDQWGDSDTYAVQVDLSSDVLDEIHFDYYPTKPVINQAVTFGGDKISIPGSTIVTWSWDFGDTSTGSGSVVSHTYTVANTYTVTLTLTDDQSNSFVITKQITVDSALSNPNLVLSASDIDLTATTTNSGTYTGTGFPETIYFSVRGTSNSNTFIEKATWNFGDGNTGFGPDVSYTYTRPGTYTVSVTGYDKNNNFSTASLTVVVPANCMTAEGQTDCLSIKNQNNHFLSLSSDSWTFERTGHLSTNALYFPNHWIQLQALDGSEALIDIGSAATVANNEITVSKAELDKLKVDYSKPYRLLINTKDSLGSPVFSVMPQVWFVGGVLNITSNEQNMNLVISHPGSGFEKFIEMGTSTVISVNDLPMGEVAVVANKGSFHKSFSAHLSQTMEASVNIDTTMFAPRALSQRSTKARKSFFKRVLEKERQIKRSSGSQDYRSNRPAWTYSLCGESAPFAQAQGPVVSDGINNSWAFSSWDPMAQSNFRSIPVTVDKPVKLNCSVKTEALLYSYNRWKYKDGPKRCFNEDKQHWYWNSYLKSLSYQDSVAKITYEVNDQWTGESYHNTVFLSPQAMIQNYGGLNNLIYKTGLPTKEGQDWSLRQSFALYIPPHFQRPQIRFELDSLNSQTEGDLFEVECDVPVAEAQDPKVIGLKVETLNNSIARSQRNGQYSLQKRFGFIPLHHDGRTTGAAQIDADVSKAKYKVDIRYYNQKSVTWQGVNVTLNYENQSHTQSYSLVGTPIVDDRQGLVTLEFEMDAADFSSHFQWVDGSEKVEMVIEPYGEDSNSQSVTGLSYKKMFVALFDLQKVETDGAVTICENGYFGSSYTTFMQSSLVSSLKEAQTQNIKLKCGSSGLPFGGPMDVIGLEKKGFSQGLSLASRSFNTSPTMQDSYDASGALQRKLDLNSYKLFSDAALIISQNPNEMDMGNPTDRKKIYDYCRPLGQDPKYPCDENTQFTDIDHDKVLEICQWYSNAGTEIDGCPTSYLDEVVRFSRWVKQNLDAAVVLNTLSLSVQFSTGLHFDSVTYTAEQWDALVYGRWPDGKPIWDVAPSGLELTNSRVIQCHESAKGCFHTKNSVLDNNKEASEIELTHQWRL